jgi:hypothetical protein
VRALSLRKHTAGRGKRGEGKPVTHSIGRGVRGGGPRCGYDAVVIIVVVHVVVVTRRQGLVLHERWGRHVHHMVVRRAPGLQGSIRHQRGKPVIVYGVDGLEFG